MPIVERPMAAANAAAASFAALEAKLDYLDAADIDLVRRAYRFADTAHLGQMRHSGEPYITHPVAVAKVLAEQGRAVIAVAIGLVVVLLICGAIEGFVTPSSLPTAVRVLIGAAAFSAFVAYVAYFGHRAVRAGEPWWAWARRRNWRPTRRATRGGIWRRIW